MNVLYNIHVCFYYFFGWKKSTLSGAVLMTITVAKTFWMGLFHRT